MTVKTANSSKPRKKENPTGETRTFDKATYLRWFKDMLLMRRFEEKAGQLYTQQKFGGFCHLYIGQEAILAGLSTAMGKEDRIITAYRDHAHPLMLGTPAKEVMAELYGRITGSSKGKGGSMHFFDKKRNLFGGHGIVGAQIAMGAGIAFADKYRGGDQVTYCFMGDGAVRQGILHETFNMAMIWKLPVVFVIENNDYAMGTSVERTSNVHDLYKLGLSYEMPAAPVNGMRCEDVHNAFSDAAAHVREGNGPFLLEIKTYRYRGHSMSDPGSYRTKEEVEDYKRRDPLEDVRRKLLGEKWATEAQLEKMDDEAKEEVAASVKFAEESPYPPLDELYIDVYKQKDYPFIKE
ncbi:MAG TPA: pyruvate dehydrogenase (acetyl-transferring) E1 component subunit alpha [Flavobacteriales bacterium]|jgi:pyruvate dehydrogenase E1 component alpha subunit|nr:pyruvate dehydrogenase (acetyl-transferring) E1 component subunit alpha [Flavobacteriales bacterium]MBK7288062.1 pyruvate dehydrogenase (acetyl-transferring) E1 component subunit alpha [Flavobacteriales bacterium]QQS74008.1 MAG: pyruvate dehydrogenase (acetyl-transferring) E1 component subunit alpha [Flavobacteriales bacterium]HQV39988.1 pyruvate dehydrogenase (acetyl-transferring) E1 component subunit alpha [Flavobacteriales bacterium]HQW33508.1 pyruvate dehydrogenase (acetyl-transferring) 